MKQATIDHINERMAHANMAHGKFTGSHHAINAARIELMEAELACSYISLEAVVAELLDAAVVCIRAAEQFAEPSNG